MLTKIGMYLSIDFFFDILKMGVANCECRAQLLASESESLPSVIRCVLHLITREAYISLKQKII